MLYKIFLSVMMAAIGFMIGYLIIVGLPPSTGGC